MQLINRVKRGVAETAKRFGYTVIPTWRLGTFAVSDHLARLFSLLQIDCVLDVGANRGQYRDLLRDGVGYKGLIVSFEPIPDHVSLLRRRAEADPRWVVEGYALGSSIGLVTLNVMKNTEYSSFRQPVPSEVAVVTKLNQVERQVEVAVKTLDSIFPELESRRRFKNVYLKLDTQGYDLEVIQGAKGILSRVLALQTEAAVKPIYEDVPDFVETIQTLDREGFELSGIFPNNEGHFPRLLEFDGILINRRCL